MSARAIPAEQIVSIALNGVRRVVMTCSPGDIDALALGHILAEGWISRASDVHSLTVDEEDAPRRSSALVEVDADLLQRTEMLRRHQTLHGCGLRHVLDCDRNAIAPVHAPEAVVDAAVLLRALFAATDEAAPDGGVHAAALSDGAGLDPISVDVARHCAVDRAIGRGIRQHGGLDTLGLVCSARISGAIALKAVRARLGWIASRSVATTLAHEIADAYGIRLLERGRSARSDA